MFFVRIGLDVSTVKRGGGGGTGAGASSGDKQRGRATAPDRKEQRNFGWAYEEVDAGAGKRGRFVWDFVARRKQDCLAGDAPLPSRIASWTPATKHAPAIFGAQAGLAEALVALEKFMFLDQASRGVSKAESEALVDDGFL